MADVRRILKLREDKTALTNLIQKGSVGDDLLVKFAKAEKELEAEVLDVVNEANSFTAAWGPGIFQTAQEMVMVQADSKVREEIPRISKEQGELIRLPIYDEKLEGRGGRGREETCEAHPPSLFGSRSLQALDWNSSSSTTATRSFSLLPPPPRYPLPTLPPKDLQQRQHPSSSLPTSPFLHLRPPRDLPPRIGRFLLRVRRRLVSLQYFWLCDETLELTFVGCCFAVDAEEEGEEVAETTRGEEGGMRLVLHGKEEKLLCDSSVNH